MTCVRKDLQCSRSSISEFFFNILQRTAIATLTVYFVGNLESELHARLSFPTRHHRSAHPNASNPLNQAVTKVQALKLLHRDVAFRKGQFFPRVEADVFL